MLGTKSALAVQARHWVFAQCAFYAFIVFEHSGRAFGGSKLIWATTVSPLDTCVGGHGMGLSERGGFEREEPLFGMCWLLDVGGSTPQRPSLQCIAAKVQTTHVNQGSI